MRTFLKKLLYFIPVSLVGYYLFIVLSAYTLPNHFRPNVVFNPFKQQFFNARLAEASTVSDVDLLFLGSSHAYRGFDPRIFAEQGYRSFNLGSSSQTPKQTEILLDRYLAQLNPKLVLYEVYPLTFEIDGIESTIGLVSAAQNDYQSTWLAISTGNFKAINTLMVGQTHQWLFSEDDSKELPTTKIDRYIQGGYVERKLMHFSPPESADSVRWNWTDDQLQAFERVLSKFEELEIPYLLVFAPISDYDYTAHTNNAEFDSLMQSYGSYINFNEQLQLNDSLHFYDANHLNQAGVELFNEAVLDVLEVEKPL